ncbi:LLM class flavin-dependent oxidoreductase [Streptomyces xanthophaeus]|uniref:LLM class flavin-dependent oxidoreductase n=1 Tax=Streptomyces xanthophaeus TaxID=67385 RepID=UPI00386543FF|nr:LLM class flavin-dependent oxidoreductase [Streptomyces xanthophaeus]WST65422.1 LLM class flavin-dependent oxidoreductase [Streptomyces xanthophaeus]
MPTGGDGRDPGGVTAVQGRTGAATRRPADIPYLAQVARAAEHAGFHSLLTPVGLGCVDPWILTAALAQHTTRIGLLVAFRAGFASPTLIAQRADAFRRFAGGRLALNLVRGGDPAEQRPGRGRRAGGRGSAVGAHRRGPTGGRPLRPGSG